MEDIEGEAERLRRITEDLLVLSRAEHALLQVVAEPIRVAQSWRDGRGRAAAAPPAACTIRSCPPPCRR